MIRFSKWVLAGLLMVLSAGIAQGATLGEVLRAIHEVENGSPGLSGDQGRARGPLQIHYVYWKDSGVPGRWSDCDRLDYSRKVVLAYWRKYCPEALRSVDAKVLARIHNGGPQGHLSPETLDYWQKVKMRLQVKTK